MNLIHDEEFFTEKEILRRAKKYEYVNPLAVEIFLWDCELVAQLQSICDDLVLKGGAATQLHLPLERQRGSVDVDVFTHLGRKDVVQTIEELGSTLKGFAEFRLHKPKKPNPELPLETYFAYVPSKTDPERDKLEIKLDFLCKCPRLPTLILSGVETFAVKIKRIRCSTSGALIGDKLLTLAKGSIGMEIEENYPKQIYDIDALLETCMLSAESADDLMTSIHELTKTEALFRKKEVTPINVLDDVVKTMDEYSLVDTPADDAERKANIEKFQQFFVNKSQRKPLYEWSTKSLRIRFLATLARKVVSEEIGRQDIARTIAECRKIEQALSRIPGDSVAEVRERIMELAKVKIPYYKDLRGKPLTRVFWQVLTLENIGDINSLTANAEDRACAKAH
jgi:hypothetical protein